MTTRTRLRARGRSMQPILAAFLIAALIWFARFNHSSGFGLYEDDWTRLPFAIEATPQELSTSFLDNLANFRGQGRPLHTNLIYTLAAIGWATGGLSGIYRTGYLIVVANGMLFYLLMRRIHSHELGIAGALAFTLYAADTTQAFITHSLGLQPSMTMLLLASHCYLSRRFVPAYSLLLASLLTYETLFFVFLGIPLLAYPWDRMLARRVACHTAILMAMFLAIFSLRLVVADITLGIVRTDARLSTSIGHMIQGPWWSMASHIDRIRETSRSMDAGTATAIAASFPVLLVVLYRWAIARGERTPEPASGPGVNSSPRPEARQYPPDLRHRRSHGAGNPWRLLAVGVLMMVLAYPLTFTTEPDLLHGRVTRNHFAAIIGHSLVAASLWTLAMSRVRRELPRLATCAVTALGLAFLLGFGQVLQRSYISSWESQKALWRDVFRVAADAGDGTAIIVDPSGLDAGLHIGANTWSMPRVLEAVVYVPSDWQIPPSAYRMNAGWLAHLHAGRGSLVLDLPAAWSSPDHVRTVTSSAMILITTDGGRIARHDSPIEIEGHIYPLKLRSQPVLPFLGRRALFGLLMPDAPG